jgi:hypothetical protein
MAGPGAVPVQADGIENFQFDNVETVAFYCKKDFS